MAFTPIGEAFSEKNNNLKKQVDAAHVVEATESVFADMFGDDAKHLKPLFLKNRTLTVTCASSSVAQELRLNQATIVENINEKLGKKEVDRIRYLA